MGYVVLPALLSDISDLYDVYFAAFKENAVTKALFPLVSSQDMTDAQSEFRRGHTLHTSDYWKKDQTQYTMKCVETETGKIVGMALWDIYLRPSPWEKAEISWLQGEDKERSEALLAPLWEARERLWHEARYIYCHVVAVHPDYQRKGIGRLLMEYGTNIASQTRLPVFIESSLDGLRLYENIGCRKLSNKTAQVKAGEMHLFIWTKDADVKIPQAVQALL